MNIKHFIKEKKNSNKTFWDSTNYKFFMNRMFFKALTVSKATHMNIIELKLAPPNG